MHRGLPVQPVPLCAQEVQEGQQDLVRVEVALADLGVVAPGPITRARAKQAAEPIAKPAEMLN